MIEDMQVAGNALCCTVNLLTDKHGTQMINLLPPFIFVRILFCLSYGAPI
jgi:hypothetical protein